MIRRAVIAGLLLAALSGCSTLDYYAHLAQGQYRLLAARQAWQSAAEAFCAQRGLSPSLLGVVVSELQQQEAGELPPGVHKFKQVRGSSSRRSFMFRCSACARHPAWWLMLMRTRQAPT